jgi:serine/threonine protein kinase
LCSLEFGGIKMIGKVVGTYKITEKLGEGGMGTVFKGVDTMLEREVAIKMLRPELARQPEVVERFRTEAVTLAKLNHPNIATLYSFLRQDDDYFMVMEFVRGNTLETIIMNFGAIAYERAIPLFCHALEGIDHAHKQGIVHRDIKPANVMVMETGSVKVMDFGIARVLGSARMTRQGSVVGTVEYMSPEQIRGEDSDARSDIYSLGILLYEMLTGRVPFNSTSEYEIMKLQIEEAPPPPTLFAAHLPLPIEQAIMRSLAKKAKARFQTAGEFRAALLGALRASTHQLNAPTGNYAAPATRLDRNVIDSSYLAEAAKGTKVAGSIDQLPAPPLRQSTENPVGRDAQSGSTQAFSSEANPQASNGQQTGASIQPTQAFVPASGSFNPQGERPTIVAQGELPTITAQGERPTMVSFQVEPQLSASGSYAQPTPGLQNIPLSQPATVGQASFFSKLNWKHYAGLGMLLIVLISVPVALTLRKGNPPAPTAVEVQPAESEQPASPETSTLQNQTPPATDSQNANVSDPLALDGQSQNSNSSVEANKARARRAEKTDDTTTPTTEEAKQAEPTPTPTTPEPKPAQTQEPPKIEEKPAAVANDADKKEAAKKEEKKKKGGIGGFFKKVFGGSDKKKEEKKP